MIMISIAVLSKLIYLFSAIGIYLTFPTRIYLINKSCHIMDVRRVRGKRGPISGLSLPFVGAYRLIDFYFLCFSCKYIHCDLHRF